MKKRISLLASFMLPLFIVIIICIAKDVYPFGDRCILQVDMYHQYCPFFTEWMDKLKTGGSFSYSWNVGLGADFVSLYAYYLASPLNWLLLIWPGDYVIEFMTFCVILKIALCGLTMGIYLQARFSGEDNFDGKIFFARNLFVKRFSTNSCASNSPAKKLDTVNDSAGIVRGKNFSASKLDARYAAVAIFATAYALSGYMAAYSWNIMWTDCLVLLPLIALGLERLAVGRKNPGKCLDNQVAADPISSTATDDANIESGAVADSENLEPGAVSRDGSPILYFVTLALCVWSNYYISIMVCIFIIIWFVYCRIMTHIGNRKLCRQCQHTYRHSCRRSLRQVQEQRQEQCQGQEQGQEREQGQGQGQGQEILAWLRFAGYSLLAVGTGAVLMIPEAVVLGYSGSAGVSFPDSVKWYFNLIPELARHATLASSYTGKEHWPNLYCGTFVAVLLILFILNREIRLSRKIGCVAILAFFWISFSNNVLDFVWHGLHFPDSLPGRQSFIYVFVLLGACCEDVVHIRGNRPWHVGVAAVANLAFWTAAFAMTDADLVGGAAFLATAVFVCFYLVLAGMYVGIRKKVRQAGTDDGSTRRIHGYVKLRGGILAIAGILAILELTINFSVTGLDTVSRTSYVAAMDDYEELLAVAEDDAVADYTTDIATSPVFYRIEELERKTKNDAALYGYQSATQFSSLMNLNVSHFYQKLGMEGGKNYYCAGGATPLVAAMLSEKYVLADNGLEGGPLRTLVASSDGYYLYENKYCLPLGFMMDEDVIDAWDYQDAASGVAAQNELASLLAESDGYWDALASNENVGEEMLAKLSGVTEVEPGKTMITVDEDGYLYATYSSTSASTVKEQTSDGRSRSFTKASHRYILDLGYCLAGTTVSVTNTVDEELPLSVYRLDLSVLDAAYQALAAQTMSLTEFSDTRIAGTIDVENEGRLVFSIADEPGWTLYVDGEKQDSVPFGDAFISVHLDEGEHEILLCYATPGIRAGAAISVSCVAAFAVIMLVRKYHSHNSCE